VQISDAYRPSTRSQGYVWKNLEADPDFAALSPSQQTQAMALVDGQLPGLLVTMAHDKLGGDSYVQNSVKTLADEHKLETTDKDGHTLLDDLATLPAELLAPAMANLADPGDIQQGNRGTCAATDTEYLLATQQPAEYARVLAGLSAGSVQLRGGETLHPNASSAVADNSGRNAPDRILQGAFMDLGFGQSAFDNNLHQSQDWGGFVDANQHVVQEAGLHYPQIEHLLGQVTGKPYVDGFTRTSDTLSAADRSTVDGLLSGPGPSLVSLSWGQGTHALVVEHTDADSVYLRNPQGNGDKGWGGVDRQRLDSEGHLRMDKDTFYTNLVKVIVPKP
jgi:hypothetical protein